jgi:hypothetical protein
MDTDSIRFKFHFLVREMHKTVSAITDCKKENPDFEGRKNEQITSRNCLSHHKTASTFVNTHEEA